MDQRNGPIFHHHDELFAQIGSAADAEQALKDLVFDASALIDMTGSTGMSSVPPVPQPDMWTHAFPLNPPSTMHHNPRPMFNSAPSFDMSGSSVDSMSTAFLDTLVKTMPDDMLDGYHSLEAIKRSLMNIPEKASNFISNASVDTSTPVLPAALLDTMHRISTDKGTQDYLDSLSKPIEHDLSNNIGWNGAVNHLDHTHSRLPPYNSYMSAIDKNGNCPTVFNNGLPDKNKINYASLDGLSSSYLVKGVSPSVSADTGIHTPTTCYDSASPMSSGRTPLLSDDSISPLASCASPANVRTPATPLRTDDCFSPGRVRRMDASPMVRTPLRCDEAPSPRPNSQVPSPRAVARTPLRNDDAHSPRPIPRTPLRNDEANSPRSIARTPIMNDDAHSPLAVARTPLRCDDPNSPKPVSRTPVRNDEAPSPRSVHSVPRTPLRVEDALSPRPVPRTPLRSDDAPSPRSVSRTPVRCEDPHSPRPIVSVPRTPVRADDAHSPRSLGSLARCDDVSSARPLPWTQHRTEGPLSPRIPVRTPLRTEEAACNSSVTRDEALSPRTYPRLPLRNDELPSRTSLAPSRAEVSPLARVPFSPSCSSTSPQSVQANQVSYVSPKQNVTVPSPLVPGEVCVPPSPDLRAGPEPVPEVPAELPPTLPGPQKPRKRRKTDSLCVPTPKKRLKKKSSGTPIYQSVVSGEESGIKLKIKLAALQPPRRRKRRSLADEERSVKRRKRSSSEPGEQSPWGRDLPPVLLERIFQHVVDYEGCVPSLVRISRVCRLWNEVANKSELWQNVDLSSRYIKQKCKIDRYFRWLLENRLGTLRDLNLNGWKFSNLPMVLSLIGTHCSEVESIGLSGWQGLHFEHLRSLLQDCPRLQKLDLSDVSPESKSTNSAVSPKSITFLTETLADRLTELNLAHNTLACLQQIITSVASCCPNLEVLDLSNIRRASHTEFALNVEQLQQGCPKLRVLRITNSCITLASVPFDEQAASPGFPALEELSVAGHQGTESLRITSVLDDDCLERIVKNSVRLRLLDVRGCTRISDSSLVRVPAWDIQHLFLSGCLVTRQPGSGLELIAQKWSHSLVEVDLAWATVTEDLNAAIIALSERGPESPLRILNLCGSSVESEPIKTLLTRCPLLESVNLQSCRGLPRGVKRLYDGAQLAELLDMLQKDSQTDSS